jgi:hypothetical protein
LTIKSTERTFNYHSKTGEKEFTKYHVEIVEKKEGNPTTFILTESENNKRENGLPIGNALVSRSAEFVAKYYELEGSQVTIFAEMRNGNFTKYSFLDFSPTIDAKPGIDFAPGGKVEVLREYVENEVAHTERWKQPPTVEFNWEEASLTPHSKVVQNPDKQQEQTKEPEQRQRQGKEPEREL